ncbi:DUF6985 domain-containing protein [Nocardia sp. NPDC059228]|uniref:DUF6985 domain-containing protein n=1 Tax=Nocardia sp. NPDC059228 TaxID=3346777 RepID=UPI003691CA8E
MSYDNELGCYRSGPVSVPLVGGQHSILVKLDDDDPAPKDFGAAIRQFLMLDPSVLVDTAPAVFSYYRDISAAVLADGDDDWYIEIPTVGEVFDHVRLGEEPAILVERDDTRGGRVYVSLEYECEWEPEHGLQVVLRDGLTVTKVGPYDGHLTNAAAFDDDRLDGVVYVHRHMP